MLYFIVKLLKVSWYHVGSLILAFEMPLYINLPLNCLGSTRRQHRAVCACLTFIQPDERWNLQRTACPARHRSSRWEPYGADASHHHTQLRLLVWLQQVWKWINLFFFFSWTHIFMLNCYLWSRQLSLLELTTVERCRAIYRDEPSEIKSGQGFFLHVWRDSCGALKQYRCIRRHLLEYRHCIYVLLRYNCAYLRATSASTNARVKIIEQVNRWLEPSHRVVLETYFFQINAIIFLLCTSFSGQCPRHWEKSFAGVF